MIDIPKIKKILANLERGRSDPLLRFVLNGEPGAIELEQIRQANLVRLFKLAKKYKVRYIYVGKYEICGCEGKNDRGGTWPAMWAIAKEMGFPSSAGNHDQYQCHDSHLVFPENSYGGWDLKTNTQLTDQETKDLKFHYVVTRFKEKEYT